MITSNFTTKYREMIEDKYEERKQEAVARTHCITVKDAVEATRNSHAIIRSCLAFMNFGISESSPQRFQKKFACKT
ncbi:hypothetical protein TNCV_938601 [Trichonephila clavipes]|nr:hypothetical protein TNCV_938601 [Trichonephila clavipes]